MVFMENYLQHFHTKLNELKKKTQWNSIRSADLALQIDLQLKG